MSKTVAALVYKLKMSAEVAAYTKNKPIVALKLPQYSFPPGTRLFMVEWNGGPVGRADLCTVVGIAEDKTTVLERRFCWKEGKLDDDLSKLSYVLQPDNFPLLTKTVIPVPPA